MPLEGDGVVNLMCVWGGAVGFSRLGREGGLAGGMTHVENFPTVAADPSIVINSSG